LMASYLQGLILVFLLIMLVPATKRMLEKHKEIVKYIFCFPFNPPEQSTGPLNICYLHTSMTLCDCELVF
jgi:hypothetical protein